LRRLLTDYGFVGYPLRKDFPLMGFFDVFYNDIESRLIKGYIVLTQGYRDINSIN
jgi:NADH-quinone oxidoreductase subunit C